MSLRAPIVNTLTTFSFFIVTLVVGCHSAPLRAPPGLNPSVEAAWLKDYFNAKRLTADKPDKACEIFTRLGSLADFPARHVAEIRALEVCNLTNPNQLNLQRTPSWLKDFSVDIRLKTAQRLQFKAEEMELALERSKQKLPQSEKLKMAQRSLSLAQELGLKDRQLELQNRIYAIAPRLRPHPKPTQLLAVATDFRLARKFTEAKAAYEKIIAGQEFSEEDKLSALKGLRLSYKNARQENEHLRACERLVKHLRQRAQSDSSNRQTKIALFDAEIYWARALWTQGQGSEAEKIFKRLEKTMRGHVSLAELYWLKARLAEEHRELDNVHVYLEKAKKERIQDADFRDKILWYSAWNDRQQKNWGSAANTLQELANSTSTDFTKARALFWLGRTQMEANQNEEAKTTFNQLIVFDPLGFYGLLAHRQLNQPISWSRKNQNPNIQTSEPQGLDGRLADWLVALDETQVLTSYLDEVSAQYKKQKEQNDDGWVRLFKYYARAGLYMKLYEALYALSPERRKTILDSHAELLFPQPWAKDVADAEDKFGVDRELIYSIIRQESAFDPQARSFADAFGLMQILPEVAEPLSRQFQVPYTHMDDLFEPRTNILLGAAHLKELFDRHKGQFILAVASYNASDKAIRNWMKMRYRGDALEFVEDIPYEETRSYVRLVIRNLVFYSLLNKGSSELKFPEKVLRLE